MFFLPFVFAVLPRAWIRSETWSACSQLSTLRVGLEMFLDSYIDGFSMFQYVSVCFRMFQYVLVLLGWSCVISLVVGWQICA